MCKMCLLLWLVRYSFDQYILKHALQSLINQIIFHLTKVVMEFTIVLDLVLSDVNRGICSTGRVPSTCFHHTSHALI